MAFNSYCEIYEIASVCWKHRQVLANSSGQLEHKKSLKLLSHDFYETPKKQSPGVQTEISPESWD